MSFYFTIIGTKDNPLFTHEFGTSKQGGDGVSRFREEARALNPFIAHSALDVLEEMQWGTGAMYLKTIDRHQNTHISAFITGANVRFLLLSQASSSPTAASGAGSSSARTNAAFAAFNPLAPATEEAIKNFFLEVYDAWVKTVMSPFWRGDQEIGSIVFRGKVASAGRKFL